MEVQSRQREVENFATDVVEEDIQVPDGFNELFLERRAFVVQRLVYSDLLL